MKRPGRPRKDVNELSDTSWRIVEQILKVHLVRSWPADVEAGAEAWTKAWLGAFDTPPARLAPGTLQVVSAVHTEHSVAALKMIWQRFKKHQKSLDGIRGPSPAVALPWPPIKR